MAGATVAGAKWVASKRDPNAPRYRGGEFVRETLIGIGGGLIGGAISKSPSPGMTGASISFRRAMTSNAFQRGDLPGSYANMSLNGKLAVAGCAIGGFIPGYCS
ncbi:hypothetical protein [Streptomyces sp. HUAS TT7]|uniref:hypothetical protein n=1 Tax=Streptomyces sp. HUAS TT7 TaxID=3447507 RepID=UPI003F65B82F